MKNNNYKIKAIALCLLYYTKVLIVRLCTICLTILPILGFELLISIWFPHSREVMAMLLAFNITLLMLITALVMCKLFESISSLGDLLEEMYNFHYNFKSNCEFFEYMIKRNKNIKSLIKEFLNANYTIFGRTWYY